MSESSPEDTVSLLPTGRFALLRHEMPATADRPSHWDFLLETPGKLATWEFPVALTRDRTQDSGSSGGARRLADHRLAYLEYEGPISGGRGHVTRVAAGRYSLVHESSGGAELVLALVGDSLVGELRLSRCDAHWDWSWRPNDEASATRS